MTPPTAAANDDSATAELQASRPNPPNSPKRPTTKEVADKQTLPQASRILQFHTGPLPTPKQQATDENADCAEIYINFVPREKILNLLNKTATRKKNTPYGTPQLGDVRRYYDKTRRQYVTSLIVAEKGKPATAEILELALENLKVQAETLNTTKIHLSLQQRILKPLTQLDMLCAIEKTFTDESQTVHIWTAQ